MTKARPTVQLTIRKLPADSYDTFRLGAAARRMTQAQFLGALLELHRWAMSPGDDNPTGSAVRRKLEQFGLDAVTA